MPAQLRMSHGLNAQNAQKAYVSFHGTKGKYFAHDVFSIRSHLYVGNWQFGRIKIMRFSQELSPFVLVILNGSTLTNTAAISDPINSDHPIFQCPYHYYQQWSLTRAPYCQPQCLDEGQWYKSSIHVEIDSHGVWTACVE